MSIDYYNILGVSKTASADEIKKAYRTLAHKHHPDKQGGNEAKFKEITTAYQTLSDPKKRQQYDTLGSNYENFSQGGGPAGGFGGFDFGQGFGGSGFGGAFNVEDLFEAFGGFGGQGRGVETRGQDIAVELTVKLTEALLGDKKIFEIDSEIPCTACKATGAKDGAALIECSTCKGKGYTKESVGRILFGSFSRTVACSKCYGSGKVPKEACRACDGRGRVRGKQRVEFEIPAGVREGEQLVMRGKGQAGFRGASSGDLHLVLHIQMPKKLSHRARELVEELSREL